MHRNRNTGAAAAAAMARDTSRAAGMFYFISFFFISLQFFLGTHRTAMGAAAATA